MAGRNPFGSTAVPDSLPWALGVPRSQSFEQPNVQIRFYCCCLFSNEPKNAGQNYMRVHPVYIYSYACILSSMNHFECFLHSEYIKFQTYIKGRENNLINPFLSVTQPQ